MTRKDIMIPEEDTLTELSELFKIFADPTRIKILFLLFRKTECAVNEISAELNISQPAVSHQLRILKNSRLVKNIRKGKSIIYSLADSHVVSILDQGLEHAGEKRKETFSPIKDAD